MQIDWHGDDMTVAAPDGAFQQSAPYAVAARAGGARVLRAVVHRSGEVMARAQVLHRRGVRILLRGPVWSADLPHEDRRHVLRRLARQAAAFVATPETQLQGFGLVPLISPRYCALWSLDRDPATLRATMAGKWRNRMVSAARRGVDIRPAGTPTLRALIEAEAQQRQARGYRALPPAFSMALPEAALRLWQWREAGQLRAAMCFVRHGAWATYHLGWADARGREVGAHGLMLWQAALALRAEGVTMLDLGDINTEAAIGLARFKLGTGATLHRLGATCLVLPR